MSHRPDPRAPPPTWTGASEEQARRKKDAEMNLYSLGGVVRLANYRGRSTHRADTKASTLTGMGGKRTYERSPSPSNRDDPNAAPLSYSKSRIFSTSTTRMQRLSGLSSSLGTSGAPLATSEFLLPVQAIHKLGKGKKKLKPLAGTEREKSSSFLTEIPTHPPAPSDAALAAEVAAETNTMLVTGQIAAAKTTTVEVVPAEMKAEVSSVEHRETGDEAMSAPAPAADEVDLTALSSTPAYAHTDDQEAVVEKEAPDASTHTDVDLDMGESSSTSTGLPLPSDSLKLNLKTGGGGAGLSVAQQKRGLAAAEAHLAAEASEISTEVSSPPPRRVRRTMTAASVMMVGETLWAERKALADAAEARMKAERLERMKRELE